MASMDEVNLEAEIKAKGLTAPRITPDMIDALIASATYTMLPSGRAMVCEMTLTNGAVVLGESIVAAVENFDRGIGERAAFTNAREKIWQLEGYALRKRIYEQQQAAYAAE